MENTLYNTENANPPEDKAVRHERSFLLEQKDGTHKLVRLENHVWRTGSGTRDAWVAPESGKSLSHHQVDQAIEHGFLIPLSDEPEETTQTTLADLSMAA